MKKIIIIITIIIILGCGKRDIPTDQINEIPKRDFKIGVNCSIKYQGDDQNYTLDQWKNQIKILTDHHIDLVAVYQAGYIDGLDGTEIFEKFPPESNDPGWLNYSKNELAKRISYIHNQGMKVELRYELVPIIEGDGWYPGYIEAWRGNLESSMELWQNFENKLINLAIFAEENQVEILNVGQELEKMTHSEWDNRWTEIINKVRQNFSGEIEYLLGMGYYNINYHSFSEPEYYHLSNNFYNLFDNISISLYPELSQEATPQASQIAEEMKYIVQIINFIHQESGKNIKIGEFAFPTVDYSAKYIDGRSTADWAWDINTLSSLNYNEDGPAQVMMGLIMTFNNKDWFLGLNIHNLYMKWDPQLENFGPCPISRDGPKKILEVVATSK